MAIWDLFDELEYQGGGVRLKKKKSKNMLQNIYE